LHIYIRMPRFVEYLGLGTDRHSEAANYRYAPLTTLSLPLPEMD
jgi:hypothetical protein